MIRSLYGLPFVNLEPYVDLTALRTIDDEISKALGIPLAPA